MQTFLKILGFITIFIGIIIGIYLIAQSLNEYAVASTSNNPFVEQVFVIKLVAGGAIIMSSIVSGMLYLSFGIVIELLDSINQKMGVFTTTERKKEITE